MSGILKNGKWYLQLAAQAVRGKNMSRIAGVFMLIGGLVLPVIWFVVDILTLFILDAMCCFLPSLLISLGSLALIIAGIVFIVKGDKPAQQPMVNVYQQNPGMYQQPGYPQQQQYQPPQMYQPPPPQ